jgi:hypothetical protein
VYAALSAGLFGGRLVVWVYFPSLFLVAASLVLLWKSGPALVTGIPLDHARWAFVLPGESSECEASDAAAKAMLDNRIDSLVLVGGRIYKTRWITELSRNYLENQGLPSQHLFEMRIDASSTLDAARQVLRLARLQGLDTLDLIVSNYQSRRVNLLYRRLAGASPLVRVYPAQTTAFNPTAWWATASSRSIWFHQWLGLLNAVVTSITLKPDRIVAEVRNLSPDIWLGRELSQTEPVSKVTESLPEIAMPVDTSKALVLLDSATKMLDSLKQAPVVVPVLENQESQDSADAKETRVKAPENRKTAKPAKEPASRKTSKKEKTR